MNAQVSLSKCVGDSALVARSLGVAIMGMPDGLQDVAVEPDFGAFVRSTLETMFASAVERTPESVLCQVQIRMSWDAAGVELTFIDNGEPLDDAIVNDLSELVDAVTAHGGMLEWCPGGGIWHLMHLYLPLPSVPQ